MSKINVLDVIPVEITGIQKYGAFATVDDDYDGLIHISEISYGYVRDVNDFVNVGDKIYAKVISVDNNNSRVKLSIKDIDYKNDGHELKRMPEAGKGFKPLKEHLDIWINDKIKEVMDKM